MSEQPSPDDALDDIEDGFSRDAIECEQQARLVHEEKRWDRGPTADEIDERNLAVKVTCDGEVWFEGNTNEPRSFYAEHLVAYASDNEWLYPGDVLHRIWVLRKVLNPLSGVEAMELLLDKMGKTKSNADFLASMQKMG